MLAFIKFNTHNVGARVHMKNDALLELIIKKHPGSIWCKDKDLVYLACNQEVLKTLGVNSYDQVIGKTDYDLMDKETAEQVRKIDAEVLDTGKEIDIEQTVLNKNKQKRVMLVNKKLLTDAKGEVIGVMGTATDITDHRRKKDLEQQQQILDEKIKTLQLIGGAFAHELRTPLATIRMAAQAIKKMLPHLFSAYHLAVDNKLMEPAASEARFQLIETVFDNIEKEVDASNNFINTLLLNIQNLAVDVKDMRALSMQKCIQEAMERYPFNVNEKEFVHVDAGHDFQFKGIDILMQHVLFNLLRNGVYYVLDSSKKEAGIHIWAEEAKDFNLLHFKDTGRGIAKEYLPKVFERFFSKRHHGTGIGLAFCKQVMTQFGGSIACDSVENEYTHFIMKFPKLDEKLSMIQA